jgi:RNA-directed DNA polymerase
MDISLIKQKASNMKTEEDLLSLLNEIKADDMGDKCYPFEMRQLNYYCNPNHSYRRYHYFNIPKKSGGTRTISAPCKGLKNILVYLNEILQAIYEPSAYAMGFTRGRSIVDNAKIHLNQNYVLNLDLKDFFPSIQQARVWKRLQLAPFNFSQDIANIVAGLCCMKFKREDEESGQVVYDYILP